MSYPENTTQQLHLPAPGYGVEDSTTQAQVRVPTQPDPTGRVPVTPPPAPTGSGRGQTTIAEDVVERVIQKVVDLAVEEVEGVHSLRPGVGKFFQSGGAESGEGAGEESGSDRAVMVTLADEQATINLSIEVEFGYAVHEVVEQVRSTVIGSAERLLGLTVAEVNVAVSDVAFDHA